MVDQPGCTIGYAPGSATGTESAALAAVREQALGASGVAAKAKKAVLKRTALQVALERLPHMTGQMFASLGQVVGKCRAMPLDDLVEQRLLGRWD